MIFDTERLIIRKFHHEDIDLIYDINNDPECIKFNGWNSMSYDECIEVLSKWINQYTRLIDSGAFCVEGKVDKEKIGMAFIVETDKKGEFEIGFRLRRKHWSHGYAKEICKGFIDYSKKMLDAKYIIGEVHKDNFKSRNVFEKMGFEKFNHPSGEEGLIYRYLIK